MKNNYYIYSLIFYHLLNRPRGLDQQSTMQELINYKASINGHLVNDIYITDIVSKNIKEEEDYLF